MGDTTRSKRRGWIVGVALVAAVVASIVSRRSGPESRTPEGAILGSDTRVPDRSREGPEEVVRIPQASSTRSSAGGDAGENRAQEPVDERVDPAAIEAWALVHQLEVLAQTPSRFHGPALPVIRTLRDVVARTLVDIASPPTRPAELGRGRAAPRTDLPGELISRVVLAAESPALVRGAVCLALAPFLSQRVFRDAFLEFLGTGSPELVRAAALAAGVRGTGSACGAGLDLGLLQSLPTTGVGTVPGVYPIALTRVVDAESAADLEHLLVNGSAMLRRANSDQTLTTANDANAVIEEIVTREVIVLVLGHRSLVDTHLRQSLMARFQDSGGAWRVSVDLRVGVYLALALSDCDERYATATRRAKASSNPIVSGITRSIDNDSLGALDLAALGRFHGERWSKTPIEQAKFMMRLAELGERLARHESVDETYRAEFTGFLREIVNDESEAENARMAAMNALRQSGDWDAVIHAAGDALRLYSSKGLKALALSALSDAAKHDSNARSSVEDALRIAQETATEPWLVRELAWQRANLGK